MDKNFVGKLNPLKAKILNCLDQAKYPMQVGEIGLAIGHRTFQHVSAACEELVADQLAAYGPSQEWHKAKFRPAFVIRRDGKPPRLQQTHTYVDEKTGHTITVCPPGWAAGAEGAHNRHSAIEGVN